MSQQQITIGLKNLKYFAHHGVYTFEKENGAWFEVDIEMTCQREAESEEFMLNETLDYEKAASVCEACMQVPTPLIETVAQRILNNLKSSYKRLTYAEVEVRKINPPIKQTCSYTYVRLSYGSR